MRSGQDYAGAVVLALPRGGVPVGFEVARALSASLDVFVVRKLGVPGHPELAMGAIASGGVRVLNESIIRKLRLSDETIESVTAEQRREVARREAGYRGGLPPVKTAGSNVVLVDDGLATGASMRAAVEALREQKPSRITVAVPTGSPIICQEMKRHADCVFCALEPENFHSVGQWYEDFAQTDDQEVQRLLNAARAQAAKRLVS